MKPEPINVHICQDDTCRQVCSLKRQVKLLELDLEAAKANVVRWQGFYERAVTELKRAEQDYCTLKKRIEVVLLDSPVYVED